jgi:hypothetical protein
VYRDGDGNQGGEINHIWVHNSQRFRLQYSHRRSGAKARLFLVLVHERVVMAATAATGGSRHAHSAARFFGGSIYLSETNA